MSEEYNGWTNRETWAVALYLNNEQSLQDDAMRIAAGDRYGDALRDYVENWLQDLVECGNEAAYGTLSDIGSLWRVDWQAVRDAFAENAAELAS